MRAGPGMLGRDGFGPPGPFAIFPNLQAGWNAAWGQLYSPRYQVLNLQDAIAQWAPASENDVGAYVSFVSKATGILPTTPMATLTAGQMTSVLTAMYRNEGNQPGQTFHRGDPNLPQWARDLFGAPRC